MRRIAPAAHHVAALSVFASIATSFAVAGSASAQMGDVIISQYLEGGATVLAPNADAIELYNGTGADIDLAAGGYKLLRYDDGATSPSATIALSGILPSRGTRVYVNAATTITALSSLADVLDAGIAFTGNDAIVLVKGAGNTVIDSVGQVGNSPASQWGSGSTGTQSNSLIRKPSIKVGRTASTSAFTPSNEWQADSAGYATTLGNHTAYYAYGLPVSALAATDGPGNNGWTLTQVGCAGSFQGDSALNGFNVSSAAGAGATAWGIWTSNGAFCSDNSEIWATRMLNGALEVGQSVSIDFDHGTIRNGKYVAVEFLSVDSEGLTNGLAAQLYFVGGESNYRLADSITRTTTIGYTADGGTVNFRLTGNGTYSLSYRGTTYTGTLGNSASSVNAVRVVNKAANDEWRYNGDEGNVFFNNLAVSCVDVDNDGVCRDTDCNDSNAAIYPGAPELCASAGTDNDCDGNTSEVDANASDKSTYYVDSDGDTYGNAATSQTACSAPTGYVANSIDCNDASAAVYPGAAELCSTASTDNDCDGDSAEIDANAADKVAFYADADNDTYTLSTGTNFCPGTTNVGYRATRSASVDCNDNNAAVKPGATEACDGVDNNCDGTIDSSSCSSITPSGNGGSSFGGAIGGSTLDVSFSGANVVFTITKGAGSFNDSLVLYIDSATGGFSTTSGFTDTGDGSRKAISGYNGSTRSTVNFASGFTANYALYISPGTNVYAGAWSLVNGGSHTWLSAATMSPSSDANAATYTVTIPRAAIGVLPGQQFKFVGTYLNPLTTVRSNEGYGEGLPASGNVSGAATFTSWLTATAPCTSSESITAPFDGTLGEMFAGASSQWQQYQPCGAGTPNRLRLVIDGQSSVKSTWRGPRFDGSIDSFTAQFKFSFRNGGGNTGDGFSFFWGDASNMTGTRWQGDEAGLNAFRTDGAGLQVCFKGYTPGTPGVTPKWGSTELATKYTQNFDAINYRNDTTCYASDATRMATATVSWTRGSGVTITLEMPGAASPITIFNNVGSATLANINPSNWYFGFAGRNGSIDQDILIGDFTVSVTRTGATYYVDMDGDGYGATGSNLNACQYAVPAGYIATGGDCDDSTSATNPGATELCDGVDNNCSGAADEGLTVVTYYQDNDGDSYGNTSVTVIGCAGSIPTGYAVASGDCNDASAGVNPGASELCDNVDNNCSGAADEGLTVVTYYQDGDGDSFGNASVTTFGCAGSVPSGYAANSGDCNDASNAVYPGAAELCANDGVDNDCDGEANADSEASNSVAYYVDGDSDNFGAGASTMSCTSISGSVTNATDCNDSNAAINPAATEICDAGNVDENCNGAADNADSGASSATKTTFYVDADSDTFTTSATGSFCDMPSGYRAAVSSPVDCDDTSAAVYPGAAELCANDGVDNDCDGEANADGEASNSVAYYVDGDSDNYGAGAATMSCTSISGSVTNATDCNDGNAAINPAAAEICDAGNVDENCNGVADNADSGAADSGKTNFYRDQDGDTFTTNTASRFCDMPASSYEAAAEGDCDDSDATIYVGAPELCANDGVDNDCDGEANADSEASNSVAYYADVDGDSFGAGTATMSCTSIAGSVTNSLDCNDSVVNYADTDNDGFGAGSPIPCGGVTNSSDGCPTDANKQSAGICGCGVPDSDTNGNGTADCADVYLALTPSTTSLVAGGNFSVRVSSGSSLFAMGGMQLAMRFDTTNLELISVTPVVGGPFTVEIGEQIDNTAGTLRYAVGISDGDAGYQLASDLCDLHFAVRANAPLCGSTPLVTFGSVGPITTRMVRVTGESQVPIVSNLASFNLDIIAPVLSGVPSNVSIAADAGSIYGAYVDPSMTATIAASDNCDGAIAVVGPTWPSDGMFPIGTTTLTWSATDSSGNIGTATRTITVANHQLLDLSMSIFGGMSGGSTQSIRVKAGADTQIVPVVFTVSGGVGSASTTVQVPVAASYSCVSAKDTVHSITKTAVPTILSERYSASVTGMRQGDSNDDDVVDITDFAIFVANRGAGKAVNAVSNFNGDTLINTADFTFLTLSFFRGGETCGAFNGAMPRERVSVRELRRTGQGELIAADLNGDGWVDLADMQLYMQVAGQ